MEKTYTSEYTIRRGSNYCDVAVEEMKRRMATQLVRAIPLEKIEKLFSFKTEDLPEGERMTFKITI